jgi:DNA replication protein DnaC
MIDLQTMFTAEFRKEVCETHGEFQSKGILNGKIWTKCPSCSAVEKEAQQKQEAAKAAEERDANWRRQLSRAEIPPRFADRTIDNYVADSEGQKRALEFAKQFAADLCADSLRGRSAIFSGGVGTGKTHMSVAIALEGMKAGKSAMFTTVQRITRDVKSTFKRDSDLSENDIIESLIYPSLLIIDEIGVQFDSKFEHNLIFDVINSRYEKRLSTILLTNLSPKDVKQVLGDRVFDRLREDGGQCVSFDWGSYR